MAVSYEDQQKCKSLNDFCGKKEATRIKDSLVSQKKETKKKSEKEEKTD